MANAILAGFQRLSLRPSRRALAREHGLAGLLLASFSLALPFLILLFAAVGISVGALRYFSHGSATTHMESRDGPPASAPQSGQPSDLYRLASIVFVPWTGVESCEKRRFDNLTGQVIYDGTAACDFPPPAEDKSQNLQLRLSGEKSATAAERMRAIHEAFKK
ncbi:MAG TPA: hypothetical protein VG986_18470 [Pseudolabrys sp.]|nr:hypothetical protein [Pseudolabrys sp.]